MAVELEFIYQGDTGTILHPRPSSLAVDEAIDADWHCWIAANYSDGTVAVAKREVTDKDAGDLSWLAALTPTETNTITINPELGEVTVDLIIEVINTTTTPPFNVERHFDLPVRSQGIV